MAQFDIMNKIFLIFSLSNAGLIQRPTFMMPYLAYRTWYLWEINFQIWINSNIDFQLIFISFNNNDPKVS